MSQISQEPDAEMDAIRARIARAMSESEQRMNKILPPIKGPDRFEDLTVGMVFPHEWKPPIDPIEETRPDVHPKT